MARILSSPAEAAYNVEGWVRNAAGDEPIQDTAQFHSGTHSWLIGGDKARICYLPTPATPLVNTFYIMRYWQRLSVIPAAKEQLLPAVRTSLSGNAPLVPQINPDGTISVDPTSPTNGILPVTRSSPITAGTWNKVEIAIGSFGSQAWNTAILRLNDVEFARWYQWTNYGFARGLSTQGFFTGTPINNIDDIIYNDDTGAAGSGNNYWNEADKPRSQGKTAPSVRSVGTPFVQVTGSTNVTVNAPPTIVAGDVLIALTYTRGTAAYAITGLPTGWTVVKQHRNSGSGGGMGIFRKIATGSEPSSYIFTGNSSQASVTVCYSIKNVDTSNPIIDSSNGIGSPGAVAQFGFPMLDLSEGDTLIIQAAAQSAASTIPYAAWWSSTAGVKDASNHELRAGVMTQSDGGLFNTPFLVPSATITLCFPAVVALRGVIPVRNRFRSVV